MNTTKRKELMMKKIPRLMLCLMLVSISVFVMTGCGIKIDGGKFLIDYIRIHGKFTAGENTTDDTTDDLFTVSMSVHLKVTNSRNNEIVVEKNKMVFSTKYESFIMNETLIGNTDNESITVRASSDGQPVIVWIKFELSLGTGVTNEEIEKLRDTLSIFYKGNSFKLPLILLQRN